MSEPRYNHICPREDQDILILPLVDIHLQGDTLADALREELITAVLAHKAQKVVLDMSSVRSISSAGLRPLLRLRKVMEEKQGRLVICGLSEVVQDVMTTTRMIGTSGTSPILFDTALDVSTAIKRLNSPQSSS